MKSPIEDLDYEQIRTLECLMLFLVKLKVPYSGETYDNVENHKVDTFCSECESVREDCYCRDDYDYFQDCSDRKYDEYKDMIAERESENKSSGDKDE